MKLTNKIFVGFPPSNLTDEEFVRWARRAFPNGAGIIEPILQRMESMLRNPSIDDCDEIRCPVCGSDLAVEEE